MKMTKKKLAIVVLVILGIILVVVIGGLILIKVTTQPLKLDRPKVATESVVLRSEKYSITYNSNGTFEPESLQVKVGDSITIKNNSGNSIQFALGEHESHLSLKGFEEKEIKAGLTYIFSPREKGNFIFHNHLIPQKFGKLSIE